MATFRSSVNIITVKTSITLSTGLSSWMHGDNAARGVTAVDDTRELESFNVNVKFAKVTSIYRGT
jgi:hypothetical protein